MPRPPPGFPALAADAPADAGSGVVLGAFELIRPIGKGGMAEVWLAQHQTQGVFVAIKVLTGQRAREPAFVRAIHNEIHNVARLAHPGVILLFDTGSVDRTAEVASRRRFVEGSTWFAMEIASHGSLSPRRFPLPWVTARMLLLSLLDALGHAHARGVIHRDLKPGNILLCAPTDPRPGIKLSDFGIAAPLLDADDGRSDEEERLSGTPRYMAPEQFQARHRDFGPWTDLYALGCIAFQLSTGKAPFMGDPMRLAMAHCHDAPPPIEAKGYPSGFGGFVLRLLAKEPSRRFQCAADAAWALLKLDPHLPDEDLTVVAGWEQALRSAPASPHLSTESGERSAVVSVASSLDGADAFATGEVDAAAEPPALSSDASEHKAAATLVERPRRSHGSSDRRFAARDSGQGAMLSIDIDDEVNLSGHSVFTRVKVKRTWATQSREATPQPSLASAIVRAARKDDARAPAHELHDADFPPIEPPSDEEQRRAPAAPTSSPELPWAEWRVLSPHENAPTLTARGEVSLKSTNTHRIDDAQLAPRLPPPMPPTWRRKDHTPRALRLLGAGLGLFGLRQIPLVDRDYERDVLWDALRSVHQGRGARVVVVRGPTGIGKTRLCEWMIERSAEVGAAVVLRARHGAVAGGREGLRHAVAAHARAVGLAGVELQARIRHVVVEQGLNDREEALALSTFIQNDGPSKSVHALEAFEPSSEGLRQHSERERHGLALRYMARAAVFRPVVLWLDDVQWGPDAIRFAESLLSDVQQHAVPLLVILSATDELLAERPTEAQLLDQLMAHDSGRVTDLQLPHLPEEEHLALVSELLGLEDALAQTVAARTAGNPLFAVTLVGDFIARGVLELTPQGFALKAGEQAVLPDDLFGVWGERIERQLVHLPSDARLALELGSVLGTAGDDGEWQAVCARAGVQLSQRLVEGLKAARLLIDDDDGLRFPHAMLREAMLRTAAEAGRLPQHHGHAAEMLLSRYAKGRRGVAERVAHHLVMAGQVEAAIDKKLEAATEAGHSAGYADAHTLLSERDTLLDRVQAPDDDVRRIDGYAARASILLDEARTDEATMWADLVLRHTMPTDATGDAGSQNLLATAQATASRVRGQIALIRGRWDEAAKRFLFACDAAVAAHAMSELVVALNGLSDASYYRGRLADSEAVLLRARSVCETEEDDTGLATTLWSLAYVAMWRGDFSQARQLLQQQQKHAKVCGHRGLVASGRNAIGDVERLRGRYDEAESRYDDALRLFVALGSGKRRTVRVNLAMNALARGHIDKAKQRALEILAELDKTKDNLLLPLCHGVLAACAAHDDEFVRFDVHAQHVHAAAASGLVDGEHAILCEIMGDHAHAHDEDDRAREQYHHARQIWQTLLRADRVAAVEMALGKIGTVKR